MCSSSTIETCFSTSSMAAHSSRKGSSGLRFSCFFFKGCFGCSEEEEEEHDDREFILEKKIIPINRTTSLPSKVGSSKRVHVVEVLGDQRVNHNKMHEMMSEKNKIRRGTSGEMDSIRKSEKSNTIQETWGNSVKKPPNREKGDKKGKNIDDLPTLDEMDPMVGALIILVTLIIMLVWGNFFAIVFGAAWIYFIPRLRANNNYVTRKNNWKEIDIDSWECKKKVVFDGFLERNQHVRI